VCFCNQKPPCRHHHWCKQAHGWQLEQPELGVMIWPTPGGRTYTTTPPNTLLRASAPADPGLLLRPIRIRSRQLGLELFIGQLMAMLPQDHEQLRPPYRKPVVSPRHGINAPGYQRLSTNTSSRNGKQAQHEAFEEGVDLRQQNMRPEEVGECRVVVVSDGVQLKRVATAKATEGGRALLAFATSSVAWLTSVAVTDTPVSASTLVHQPVPGHLENVPTGKSLWALGREVRVCPALWRLGHGCLARKRFVRRTGRRIELSGGRSAAAGSTMAWAAASHERGASTSMNSQKAVRVPRGGQQILIAQGRQRPAVAG